MCVYGTYTFQAKTLVAHCMWKATKSVTVPALQYRCLQSAQRHASQSHSRLWADMSSKKIDLEEQQEELEGQEPDHIAAKLNNHHWPCPPAASQMQVLP